MASDRYFTILVVPEKSSHVRRIIIPRWLFRSGIVSGVLLGALAAIMLVDYWYVVGQIDENRQLHLENRRLKQQVQIFKNKMDVFETTLERIKTFSTRLRVITNLEDRGMGPQSSLEGPLPDAAGNIKTASSEPKPEATAGAMGELTQILFAHAETGESAEEARLRAELEQWDSRFNKVHEEGLWLEHSLQDQYELLADQRSFLDALPTRRPAIGYYTSGFGVRRSPYGGREKMHEGLDIANHPGTPIYAPADGTVASAAVKPGYGSTLVLDHGYGLETWYAHTRKILVNKGQTVRRGERIALLGNSGRSTGPHVHYEVRVHGTPVDPLTYILEN